MISGSLGKLHPIDTANLEGTKQTHRNSRRCLQLAPGRQVIGVVTRIEDCGHLMGRRTDLKDAVDTHPAGPIKIAVRAEDDISSNTEVLLPEV